MLLSANILFFCLLFSAGRLEANLTSSTDRISHTSAGWTFRCPPKPSLALPLPASSPTEELTSMKLRSFCAILGVPSTCCMLPSK